ncbi:MAG: tRNA (guanine(26)-N(2))-dimethyltransferase [Nanoarchaeota archaeon]
MQTITEGKAIIQIPEEVKISRQMEVFYNQRMKSNRDLTVAVLNAWGKNNLQIADLFAASGIRAIRILKECKKEKIEALWMNDHSPDAIQQIKENLKQNNLDKDKRITIEQKDANMFLLESHGFDYIDLDPFGTPVAFLDSACKRIARDGILAVTATDTSALCGSFPDACKRKYGATPLRCAIMHELGLRILIKKCQEIGAQYDKALEPMFSYAKDHYMRVFFLCKKGKEKANDIVSQHKVIMINNNPVGPLWKGQLWDKDFVKNMETEEEETKKFLNIIKEEAMIEQVGFHEIHALCKKNKLHIPQYLPLMSAIKEAGHKVARTHFSLNGMRSTISEKELLEIIKNINASKSK